MLPSLIPAFDWLFIKKRNNFFLKSSKEDDSKFEIAFFFQISILVFVRGLSHSYRTRIMFGCIFFIACL